MQTNALFHHTAAAVVALASIAASSFAQSPQIPSRAADDTAGMMSPKYWALWNDTVQQQIDADIELYRKADATLRLPDVKRGTTVRVEQVSSDFVFGASAFNFGQLGTDECNRRYRELFGTLFNRATVGVYWRTQQPRLDAPMRFAAGFEDAEGYWNTIPHPKERPYWRRPASDPIVDWCASRGVAVHIHPLAWGNLKWHLPPYLHDLAPAAERLLLDSLENLKVNSDLAAHSPRYDKLTPEQLADLLPGYAEALGPAFDRHMLDIMEHYHDNPAVKSYDVVNESSTDFGLGRMVPDAPFCKSRYALLPGDYAYRALRLAADNAPKDLLLNINDYNTTDAYPAQVADLLRRDCRIDVVGMQMHLFRPQQCLDIAAGAKIQTPAFVRDLTTRLSKNGRPICISEITISSPSADARGEMQQAIIARNLYRLWFSTPKMMGITWWNIVDGCGAPGEPTVSGLFHHDMTPKTSYHALEQLILHEWRTSLSLKPGKKGLLSWRGFTGRYLITYTDRHGRERTCEFELKSKL